MDRLQTKCLVASLGFHALLVTVVLACSTIQWRKPLNSGSHGAEASIIQLVTVPADQDARTTTTRVPAAALQRNTGPNSDAPQRPIQPATGSITSPPLRHQELAHSSSATAASNVRLLEFSRALENVANHVPTGKAIALELSSNTGSKDDSYSQIVKFLYSQSWEPAASENADSNAAAKAKITIASDGMVSSASIIESSGDPRLDESIRHTLHRVQFIEPFEPGAKESERTYTINFSLHAALSAGP